MTQKRKRRGVSLPFTVGKVKLYAIRSRALDVDCYRGFASIANLARISRPDEYNEINHKEGIQRDLNKKHAREAYDYAASIIRGQKRIWPEIILSLRDEKGIEIKGCGKVRGLKEIYPVIIKIDLDKIRLDKVNPTFSRVDGNHRLYYAGGIDKKRPELNAIIPFCIIEKVSRNEEVLIFKTINEKQVRLKTDHLLRITGQITRGIDLMERDPVLWLTHYLREDDSSPFYRIVHIAGAKSKGEAYIINQKSLYDGIRIFYKALDVNLKQGNNLRSLPLIFVRYFSAVKRRWTTEWNSSKKYLLMSNTGMQAIGIVGAQLVERQIRGKKIHEDDFYRELKTAQFSWEKVQGDKKLPTGRAGAEIIAQGILNSMSGTTINLSQLLQR